MSRRRRAGRPTVAAEPDPLRPGVVRLTAPTSVREVARQVADAFAAGADRVEADLPADDVEGARILRRSGFRFEGRRRGATVAPDGRPVDVLCHALLRGDPIDGPEGFSAVMTTVLPKTRVIAHVLFSHPDPSGERRHLVCRTTFKSDWELPGGIVEADESPRLGAEREVAEELGIVVQVGRVLAIDWLPPMLGWEDALELIFDGGDVHGRTLSLQSSEIAEVAWLTLSEAVEVLRPSAAERLRTISDDPATMHYLEDGRPPR